MNRYSILDFPPGPRDDPRLYDVMWDVVEEGLIRPTERVVNGQRVFASNVRRPTGGDGPVR